MASPCVICKPDLCPALVRSINVICVRPVLALLCSRECCLLLTVPLHRHDLCRRRNSGKCTKGTAGTLERICVCRFCTMPLSAGRRDR